MAYSVSAWHSGPRLRRAVLVWGATFTALIAIASGLPRVPVAFADPSPTITVTDPTLTPDPSTPGVVPPFGSGQQVTVKGTGFPANSTVDVWIDPSANGVLGPGVLSSPSVPVAGDGTFATPPFQVFGTAGDYSVVALSGAVSASLGITIQSCFVADNGCRINGGTTICLVGLEPSDFLSYCKLNMDTSYTEPTNTTPNGGYDFNNQGTIFAGAGVFAAAVNDLGALGSPPGPGCAAMTAAIAYAESLGGVVPGSSANHFDSNPLHNLGYIACGSPGVPLVFPPTLPFDLLAPLGPPGYQVPSYQPSAEATCLGCPSLPLQDQTFLVEAVTAVQVVAAAAAAAITTAGLTAAASVGAISAALLAGGSGVVAALTPLLALVGPQISALAMVASLAALLSTLVAGALAQGTLLFASALGPFVQAAILTAAQTAMAFGAVAGAEFCGFVNYFCRGSDITANFMLNNERQRDGIPVPLVQPPFPSLFSKTPYKDAECVPPVLPNQNQLVRSCWGAIIGWSQVLCKGLSPNEVQPTEADCADALAAQHLPAGIHGVPGSAGSNNSMANNVDGQLGHVCVTGTVVDLSIGYDGDLSFALQAAGNGPDTITPLTNWLNWNKADGDSEPPNGIDIEIAVYDRNRFSNVTPLIRKDTVVHVCGQFVADMNRGWNELHPIDQLDFISGPSTLNLPANITVEATGPAGAPATFTASATDVAGGPDPVTCNPPSGSIFALGTTTVTCSATDSNNVTFTGTFTVTVQDTTAPTLTLPASITVDAAGPTGAVVTYTATATDLVDGTDPVTCLPISGSTFTIGTATVTCSSTDAHGNTATGTFMVTVRDNDLALPGMASVTVTAAYGASGAAVTYTPPTAIDEDGTATVACLPTSGSTFAAGQVAPVTCTATDPNDDPNSGATSAFTVNVIAPTTLLYTGTQIVIEGTTANTVTPAAQLTSGAPACTGGQTVSFAVTPNPLGGGALALGTATTNAAGRATFPAPISTAGWAEGVYAVTATFSPTTSCGGSTDQATLTVGSAGDTANGGGWYNLPGSGRVNFGLTIQNVPNTNPTQYKGQLLLLNTGKWKLNGSFSGTNSYAKTAINQGGATGTGDLYWWNPLLNGGLGDWQLALSAVSFTISFTGGTNVNGTCNGANGQGCFGAHISYASASPQPATLPNSTQVPIKGGRIKLN